MKMFGSIDKFMYQDLAGIRKVDTAYRHVLIKPQVVGDLQSVTASQKTIRGQISVSWTMTKGLFDLSVSIPVGVDAEIVLPDLEWKDLTVTEGGAPLWRANKYVVGVPGLISASKDLNSIVIRVGSGDYHFAMNGVP